MKGEPVCDVIDILFPVALAAVAIHYSAVGQAGGTGYVALMGLAGFAPVIIKPTALSLNVFGAHDGRPRFDEFFHFLSINLGDARRCQRRNRMLHAMRDRCMQVSAVDWH